MFSSPIFTVLIKFTPVKLKQVFGFNKFQFLQNVFFSRNPIIVYYASRVYVYTYQIVIFILDEFFAFAMMKVNSYYC